MTFVGYGIDYLYLLFFAKRKAWSFCACHGSQSPIVSYRFNRIYTSCQKLLIYCLRRGWSSNVEQSASLSQILVNARCIQERVEDFLVSHRLLVTLILLFLLLIHIL